MKHFFFFFRPTDELYDRQGGVQVCTHKMMRAWTMHLYVCPCSSILPRGWAETGEQANDWPTYKQRRIVLIYTYGCAYYT